MLNSQAPEASRGPPARFARSGENGDGVVRSLFFHRFGIAVNTGPWEPENTPIGQLWRNGRLRVNGIEIRY